VPHFRDVVDADVEPLAVRIGAGNLVTEEEIRGPGEFVGCPRRVIIRGR
jgi:hypothetical protein